MATESDKKIVVFYVLEILEEYSDDKHPLTYKEIIDKIDARYGVRPNVKSIAANIDTLIEAGYEIEKRGYKGCYLAHRGYETGELLYLIDAINSSTFIAPKHAKELIGKLTKNCSRYQKNRFSSLQRSSFSSKSYNRELFYVIEILAEAIELGKKVSFSYNEYKFYSPDNKKKEDRKFVINPYFMVNSRGKYYLVCNYDKYDNISNYKIEYITDIKILDQPIKPIKMLHGTHDFSIDTYIKEHIYMTYGDSVFTKIRVSNPKFIADVKEWFGEDVFVQKLSEEETIVQFKVNEQALIYWALQYGSNIEILQPLSTREKFVSTLKSILDKYKEEK